MNRCILAYLFGCIGVFPVVLSYFTPDATHKVTHCSPTTYDHVLRLGTLASATYCDGTNLNATWINLRNT
jgi:hypothetical protein